MDGEYSVEYARRSMSLREKLHRGELPRERLAVGEVEYDSGVKTGAWAIC